MGSSMTIGKRFLVTSGILVLLCTAITAVAIVSLNGINRDVRSMSTDTIPAIVYASAIRNDVLALRGDFLKHIAESDKAMMVAEEQSIANNDAHLTEDLKGYEDSIQYEDATAQTTDRDLVSKLEAEIAAVHQGWDKVRPISRGGKNVDAFQLYTAEVTPNLDQMRAQLASLVDTNKKASDATDASTAQTVQTSWWLVLVLGMMCDSRAHALLVHDPRCESGAGHDRRGTVGGSGADCFGCIAGGFVQPESGARLVGTSSVARRDVRNDE